MEANEVKLVFKRKIELSEMPKVLSTNDVYKVLKECFDPETIDLITSFKVMLLNHSKNVISVLNVSEGHSFAKTKVRMIMQAALLSNADRIIIAHNHTDGDLTIRALDDFITKEVKKISYAMGIELLDHLIITSDNGYYSFADNGRL